MAETYENSRIKEIEAALTTNLSYVVDDDVTKAREVIHTATILLAKRPEEGSKGGRGGVSVRYGEKSLQQIIDNARAFVSAASGDYPAVVDVDFIDFDART